ESYKRFISSYGSNQTLLSLVYQKLGYAYLLKGDLDQAAKAYSSVLEMQGSANRDQAIFELARLEENREKPEAAAGYYQDLIKTYPNSPLANEAALRVKVLEAKKSPESGTAPSLTPATPSKTSPKP
ncbi:MAG TPA: tetratricopeptide repeat protein, partial [Nitrospira sp.]|nr:tetratricopeptide repeat protein [Nitrospira sp.]